MMNNVRGYRTRESDIIRIILEEKPAIIGLTETKLKEGEEIDIPGYQIARNDRKKWRRRWCIISI